MLSEIKDDEEECDLNMSASDLWQKSTVAEVIASHYSNKTPEQQKLILQQSEIPLVDRWAKKGFLENVFSYFRYFGWRS